MGTPVAERQPEQPAARRLRRRSRSAACRRGSRSRARPRPRSGPLAAASRASSRQLERAGRAARTSTADHAAAAPASDRAVQQALHDVGVVAARDDGEARVAPAARRPPAAPRPAERCSVPSPCVCEVTRVGCVAAARPAAGACSSRRCWMVQRGGRACRASTRRYGEVVLLRLDLDRHLLGHRAGRSPRGRRSCAGCSSGCWIVDEAEVGQDLRADAVVAQVGREAELDVGLDGVAGPAPAARRRAAC